jgi:hypothetical protein
MTPEQTKRVREIAENKARKFCIETNMDYVPNFMYMANIAILAALDDPLLNGYVEALEDAAKVCDEWSKRNDDVGGYCAAAIRAMKKEER